MASELGEMWSFVQRQTNQPIATVSKNTTQKLALLNSQSLSINQRVAAEAFDYLLQLTTGKLRRFATYFDLESGSGRSLYTIQTSVIQSISQPSN